MIQFPGSKINIGLNILRQRNDGFHDIESVFYPVRWSDIVEVVPSNEPKFTMSGLPVSGSISDNLCLRALERIDPGNDHPVHIHLHKTVPMGAGLGGGSADGTAVLELFNRTFNLGHSQSTLMKWAAELGSDCPFFVRHEPQYVTGRGERLEKVDIDLSDYYILIVHPGIHVSTKDAYSMAIKGEPAYGLREVIKAPVEEWKEVLINGFEAPMIDSYPEIGEIRDKMYADGGLYASMTGSGSAVYGIFKEKQETDGWPGNYAVWSGTMAT